MTSRSTIGRRLIITTGTSNCRQRMEMMVKSDSWASTGTHSLTIAPFTKQPSVLLLSTPASSCVACERVAFNALNTTRHLRTKARIRRTRPEPPPPPPPEPDNAEEEEEKDSAEEDEDEEDEKDKRPSDSLKTIIFGTPPEPPPWYLEEKKRQWESMPKNIFEWMEVIKMAWAQYYWTLEGSLLKERGRPPPYMTDEQREEYENSKRDYAEELGEEFENIKERATGNATFLAEEGEKLVEQLKEKTGIKTRDDAREFASEQLKLLIKCLNAFMKGYRKGRDEEIEKMIHEYFQDNDDEKEEQDKRKRRRRIKRRIRTPD